MLVAGVVDVCLIPEVPFVLQGEKGLFAYLEKVLENRGHAVVCLAEGAGQVCLLLAMQINPQSFTVLASVDQQGIP